MFGIRRKDRRKSPVVPGLPRQDALNRTVTTIAIKLIQGDCNALYKREMTQLFLESPGFVDDVAPEYRQALQKLLKKAAASE
jgi:hypothetical protein